MKKIFNNEINETYINQTVELTGWVNRVRNLGGLLFIDLRDRTGIIQLVVNPENEFYETATNLKNEYVIRVSGKVVERISANEKIDTGKIEVIVENLTSLFTSLKIYLKAECVIPLSFSNLYLLIFFCSNRLVSLNAKALFRFIIISP